MATITITIPDDIAEDLVLQYLKAKAKPAAAVPAEKTSPASTTPSDLGQPQGPAKPSQPHSDASAGKEQMHPIGTQTGAPAQKQPGDTSGSPGPKPDGAPDQLHDQEPPSCKVHHTPMRQGKGGKYFCPRKNRDGSWCKEKA